jgi:hypothetical protein
MITSQKFNHVQATTTVKKREKCLQEWVSCSPKNNISSATSKGALLMDKEQWFSVTVIHILVNFNLE